MAQQKPQPTPPDTQGGPESIMPGERSGEGSKDLFKHIERDVRRKERVLPPARKPDDKKA